MSLPLSPIGVAQNRYVGVKIENVPYSTNIGVDWDKRAFLLKIGE